MNKIALLFLILLVSCAAERIQTADPVGDALYPKRNKFRQCYLDSDSYYGKYATENGKVTLAFTVDEDGDVQNPKIKQSDYRDEKFHACLLNQVKKISLPEPVNGKPYQVQHSLSFKPER